LSIYFSIGESHSNQYEPHEEITQIVTYPAPICGEEEEHGDKQQRRYFIQPHPNACGAYLPQRIKKKAGYDQKYNNNV